jgi:hypothetical protein
MKGHDFMHNTTMPLNVMELLYGVIPMALTMFHILNLKNINYPSFTMKISLSEVHIHNKVKWFTR